VVRYFNLLRSEKELAKAHQAVDRAYTAGDMEIEFRKQKRTSEQNARMWVLLGIIAKRHPVWNGVRMNAERWKSSFMDALGMEVDWVPKIDGHGVVPIGHKTSQLSKSQFSDLFEIIHAFAAREGIDLKEPQPKAARSPKGKDTHRSEAEAQHHD